LCRIFATTPRHRKDVARIPQPKSTIPSQTGTLKSKKPDVVEAKAAKPKQDILLAEQTVSNAQQRKADWAILKEMTAYLWPKVRTLQDPGQEIGSF
jgi:ATP-binding cassette, subfamily B (MDR/TAP), member 7